MIAEEVLLNLKDQTWSSNVESYGSSYNDTTSVNWRLCHCDTDPTGRSESTHSCLVVLAALLEADEPSKLAPRGGSDEDADISVLQRTDQ